MQTAFEKLIVTQLAKRLPAFHGTLRYNVVFTKVRLGSYVIQLKLVHTRTSYFFKMQFKIILPSTSISHKWCLPFRFSG